jgi:uncharacterized RDD family membrane protein YckC
MSDNDNPRLKSWMEQAEQSKYQSDRQINTSQQVNKSVIYHVIQNESVLRYVGFWRRFFAQIVDWIVLTILSVFLFYLLTAFQVKSVGFFQLLAWFLYYTIFPSTSLKGTIGKLAVGAVIVDKNKMQLKYSHSVGRFFANILSGGILFIGYIMVAANPEKRGLHDMMAGTYVVNKK